MTYFLLSIAALVLAPLLYLVVQKVGAKFYFIEGALFFLIAGLVVLHILPEAIEQLGWWAVVVALAGWMLPYVFEKFSHSHDHDHHHKVHLLPVIVSFIGLGFHGFLDGVALAISSHNITVGGELHVHALPIAVVLHRFPAAVFIWWIVCSHFSKGAAMFCLIAMGLLTTIGYFGASAELHALHDTTAAAALQALVGGSLLHLAAHRIQH